MIAKVWRRTVIVPKRDGSIGRREESVCVSSFPSRRARSLQEELGATACEWVVRSQDAPMGLLLGHFTSEESCRLWLVRGGYRPTQDEPDPGAIQERAA